LQRLAIKDLPLPGLKRVERRPLRDARGTFARLFCAEELRAAGWSGPVAQVNHSATARKGTVRGLHFQYPPHAEMKLVNCIRGEVFDVVVDLRRGSPTFLQWHAERLSADNGCALLIPQGFAHGFQTLADDAELVYCHSAAYAPAAEGGLDPRDARLAIGWPLPIAALSERDARHPALDATFTGIAP
jgi:dTDP-4-dehydrorhamnose 3,5-epimerase